MPANERDAGVGPHQQGIDTATPAGKALFQMLGVFAEFERSMIVERVKAGLRRAWKAGKTLGRTVVMDEKKTAKLRALRAQGSSIRQIAAQLGVGVGTVQRAVAGL